MSIFVLVMIAAVAVLCIMVISDAVVDFRLKEIASRSSPIYDLIAVRDNIERIRLITSDKVIQRLASESIRDIDAQFDAQGYKTLEHFKQIHNKAISDIYNQLISKSAGGK
jgi:hypothetical protein